MRTTPSFLLRLSAPLVLALVAQPSSAQETDATSSRAEELRGRIHDMRMDLLLGGDKVQAAESEAVGFYNKKIQTVEQGLDSIEVDLSEKRASYGVALDQSLDAATPAGREAAMRRAQALRGELARLEADAARLRAKRGNLGKLIGAVQARGRERQVLAGRLEASGGFDDEMWLSLGMVGLAPETVPPPDVSPLADGGLVADLMRRDPRAASRLLFEQDPDGFWKRFPLTPPVGALHQALTFPLPDLPGRR